MARSKSKVPPEQLALYDKLIATRDDIVRKGAASAYTSLNGHMFSFMDGQGALSLRLPKQEREAFLKDHKTQLSVQHGAVMKEYVVVPESLLRRTEALAPYLTTSVNYIASLKPKPTKRKKAGVKKKSMRRKK